MKIDEAMGDAKKNCRLMILDFRLELHPLTADWLTHDAIGHVC